MKNRVHKMPKVNFVKMNLSRNVPTLLEFIGDLDFPWDTIERKFSEDLKRREREWKEKVQNLIAAGLSREEAENTTIRIEACVYHLIVQAIKGNDTSIGFLHFLELLFQELTDNLLPNEKLLIRTCVKNMLMKFDLKYHDFLGEIAVLNYFIKLKTYRLEGIEKRIELSKPIDFKLKCIRANQTVWIEVCNIHLDSEKVIEQPEAIEKFLRGRLTKKLSAKKVCITEKLNYNICPVLWGDARSLKFYNEFFIKTKFKMDNVLEPMAYLTYSYSNGYKHFFKPISSLFLK
jgi:hypothetical protein